MTVAKSKEARWFFDVNDDTVPAIIDWFKHLKTSVQLSASDVYPRQDYYLHMPGVKDLGVKIREPKKDPETGKLKTALEIKRLLSENEQTTFDETNTGYTNVWLKYSYDLAEGGENILTLNPLLPSSDKSWLKVDKDRVIVKYDSESKTILDGNTRLKEACGIELTKIRILEKVYYSFALEAFSESGDKLNDNFLECAEYIFSSQNINGLTLNQSFSYPQFLSAF